METLGVVLGVMEELDVDVLKEELGEWMEKEKKIHRDFLHERHSLGRS